MAPATKALRRFTHAAGACALVVLIGGCDPTRTSVEVSPAPSPTNSAAAPTTSTTSTSTAAPASSSTSPPAADQDAPACASGDLPYRGGGQLGVVGEGPGDAGAVGGLRWTSTAQCDRIVVDFVTANGSPASTLGATEVEYLAEAGVIMATLPESVTTTAVADAVVDAALVERAHFVRLLDGRLAVSLHVSAPQGASIRALTVDSPARLVFDLEPGGTDPVAPPPATDRLVVLEPQPGVVEFPLMVRGYARVPSVVATLPAAGEDFPIARATLDGVATTWVEFEVTLVTGPPGTVELFVGQRLDAADGIRMMVQRS